MTDNERKLALYCLKASSDYHLEVCEECINYPNCDHTMQDDVTETIIKALEQTDGDLISRKAVIQALKENAVEIGGEEYSGMGVCEEEIESIVNGVPSAENTAEWINKNISDWECSNCGTTFYVIKKPFYIFCPNCGARMKGVE